MQDLCIQAPSIAQYLAQEILNHLKDDSQPEVQGSQELETSTNTKRSSEKRRQPDRSYRLPKSSKTQPDIPRDEVEDSHEAFSVSSQVDDELVTRQSSHDDITIIRSNDGLVTEKRLQECERDIPGIVAEEVPQEGVQGQPSAHGCTMPSVGSESALHQLKATYSSDSAKGNAVHRQPSVALDESTGDSQTALLPPLRSEAEQQETAFAEIDGKPSDA